jgi:hypothetical protein
MMLAERFTELFRVEHRQVRDGLLELIEAFEARDQEGARTLLARLAALTGPHFRYEEEALYPALVGIFEEAYVELLLSAHDKAIASARRLVALASQDALSDEQVREAVHLIRTILPHVSDCDGLSIMTERLPQGQVQAVLDARDRSLREGLDLLQWAAQVRARGPALV